MAERLSSAGVEVDVHAESYPNGRFAELEDPEGNGIQLWEPNAASIARDPGEPQPNCAPQASARLDEQ